MKNKKGANPVKLIKAILYIDDADWFCGIPNQYHRRKKFHSCLGILVHSRESAMNLLFL